MLYRELMRCDLVRKRCRGRRLRWRWLYCGSGAHYKQRLELRSEMRRDDSRGSERDGDMCFRRFCG